jgi:hypothetical protein
MAKKVEIRTTVTDLVQEMSMMIVRMRMLERMPAVVESQGWWYMMCRSPENSAWISSWVLYTCNKSCWTEFLFN